MVKRFRMVAGPNGSGKSTLVKRLQADYKVNFYTFVNADDILAQVLRTGAYSPKFPVSKAELGEDPKINKCRVENRCAQGGHDVPSNKIFTRYPRSIAQLRESLPYLSRAYVFDNSGSEMLFLGEFEKDRGWFFSQPIESLPTWFASAL